MRSELLYLFEFIVFDEVNEFDTFEHALRNGSILLWVVLTSNESSPQEVKRYSAVFASVKTQSDLLGTIFLGRDTHTTKRLRHQIIKVHQRELKGA